MNTFSMTLLQAAGSSTGSMLTSLIPFALIILIFYFLIIRPQNKKQKETQKMLEALKKGDKVVTVGGVHGVVQSVKESTVVVKVDENCKLEFSRSAVASVAADETAAKAPAKKSKAKKEETVAEEAPAQIEEKK